MNLDTFREWFRKISYVYIQLFWHSAFFVYIQLYLKMGKWHIYFPKSAYHNYISYQQLVSGPVN